MSAEVKEENPETQFNPPPNPPPISKFPFTFRHLYTLATAAALAATGMVSPQDIFFVFFSLIYIHLLSKFSFPILSTSKDPPVFAGNRVLPIYVSVAAVIGLLLPIIYIICCVFVDGGHRIGAEAATPHLFLLASQVFMEGVAFSGRFSLPIRVFVPVFYNSRRIFSIVDWLRAEFLNSGGGSRLGYFGRGLAVANMGLWCFNLFAFLLPVYLPKAFKIYYSTPTKKEVED